LQMQTTCHCGHMYFPACTLRPSPENDATIKQWRSTHEGRAEEEIAKIREENHNAFIMAPFKWNGFMRDGTDLFEARNLRSFSKEWSSPAQLYSKDQENTEPQIHAPANATLLEEARLAKGSPTASYDGWKPANEEEKRIDDLDTYDEPGKHPGQPW
jgi:hypothetical protein